MNSAEQFHQKRQENWSIYNSGAPNLTDVVSENLQYLGWGQPGSATNAPLWRIQRISKTGTVTSITWADGNQNFDNIWDNRASLNYL